MHEFVAYCRHDRRIGIAAQEDAAKNFIAANRGRSIGSFVEAKPGRTPTWPALREAIAAAKEHEATLVIAYAGRLARNVVVTSMLRDSGVHFVCCDMPNANHLTVAILAAAADEESQRVRSRTRRAMAAAKARGAVLGAPGREGWDGSDWDWRPAVEASVRKRKERTAAAYRYLLPEIKARRERGETLAEIVEWLNQAGYTTTRGMPFTQPRVWHIINNFIGPEYLGNNVRRFTKVRP